MEHRLGSAKLAKDRKARKGPQSSQRTAKLAKNSKARKGPQSSQRTAKLAKDRKARKGPQSSQRTAKLAKKRTAKLAKRRLPTCYDEPASATRQSMKNGEPSYATNAAH